MLLLRSLLALIIGLMLYGTSSAQTKIEGILIDSTYNNILRSATVSVYKQGEKSVDKITLTDRFGKFILEDISAEKDMRIEFSYQGFEKVVKEFLLKKDEHKNFGKINMRFVSNEMEEVEIFPPVRMNGDTLEFNADAFELDSNAVIEDLLHKLPGLVVWGDGAVTYNGKEIPSVLVNGKSFFGEDKAIVLQNIDKKAVDKIQIYDNRTKEKQKEDPEDKRYEMNVMLKEGKEKMYFGNMSAGLGTDDRYQGALNLNYSTKKAQTTIAYSTNNVNKDLQSVDQLLKNTTYKGIGVNADFDSDFLRSGLLTQHVLGARYQYDVLGTNEVGKQNIFLANVISHWNKTNINNESITQLLNVESDRNTRTYSSDSETDMQRNIAMISYDNSVSMLGARPISLRSRVNANNYSNNTVSNSISEYDYDKNRSKNEIINSQSNTGQSLGMSANFNVHGKAGRNMTVLGKSEYTFWDQVTYGVDLNANTSRNSDDALKSGDYNNFTDESQNRLYHRTYDENKGSQQFDVDIKAGSKGFTIWNKISYYGTVTENQVYDLNAANKNVNNSLTHHSEYSRWQYEPRIQYSKSLFFKNLYGRMYSSLYLNLKVGARLYRDDNVSTLDYRNLGLKYNSFLPNVSLDYSYSKTSKYNSRFGIQYNYNEEYEFLDRMRPIYDDINPAYRYYGSDRLLDKTGVHTVGFNSSYNQTRQYGYNLSLYFNYRVYQNGLTDSIVYANNEQQGYVAQIAEPMDVYSFNLNANKPFLVGKDQTLTFNLNGSGNWGNKFQYIDSKLQEMLNNTQNITLNTYYTLVNKYQVGWTNYVNRYQRKDRMGNTKSNNYESYAWSTGLSMAYAFTKKWSVNTNATGRFNNSTYNNDQALIWNANTTYRLLQGNTLEIKFAAYDLLRQNKGLYYTNGVTEFTTGSRNILTQYYMLSISYFPRKFGLK